MCLTFLADKEELLVLISTETMFLLGFLGIASPSPICLRYLSSTVNKENLAWECMTLLPDNLVPAKERDTDEDVLQTMKILQNKYGRDSEDT